MRKLSIFNQISLDGFFVDSRGDMSWAHKSDPEWTKFASRNAGGDGELIFGRVTYEMMAAWWPSPAALQMDTAVAKGINAQKKYVFSRSLKSADWNNTTLIKRGLETAVKKLKATKGGDLVVLGSGEIVSQLAAADLIDTYTLVINPIILGSGRSLFEGVKKHIDLKRTASRAFKNGNVVISWER